MGNFLDVLDCDAYTASFALRDDEDGDEAAVSVSVSVSGGDHNNKNKERNGNDYCGRKGGGSPHSDALRQRRVVREGEGERNDADVLVIDERDDNPAHEASSRNEEEEVSSLPASVTTTRGGQDWIPLGKIPLMKKHGRIVDDGAFLKSFGKMSNVNLGARCFAKMCVAALRDWWSMRDRNDKKFGAVTTMRVVDLVSSANGARRVLALRSFLNDFEESMPPNTRCVVVLTDPSEAFARRAAELYGDIEGIEFGVFDPSSSSSRSRGVRLVGKKEESSMPINRSINDGPPLVCISVGVTQCLAHDVVQIRGGRVSRAHVRLGPPVEWTFKSCEGVLARGGNIWEGEEAGDDGEDGGLANTIHTIVRDIYANSAEHPELGRGATIPIPIGTMAMVRDFIQITRGNLVMICQDEKAATWIDEFLGTDAPKLVPGPLGVSIKTNFHILPLFAQHFAAPNVDGVVVLGHGVTTPYAAGTKLCALFFVPNKQMSSSRKPSAKSVEAFMCSRRRRALLCFRENMCGFGPSSVDEYTAAFAKDCPSPSLDHMLCVLRLCAHDAHTYFGMKKAILRTTLDPKKSPLLKKLIQEDVKVDLERVADKYFGDARDVSFEVGRVFMAVKEYSKAIRQFRLSIEHCGDHHISRHNIGLCFYYRGDMDAAVASFKEALAIKSDYAASEQWLEKLMPAPS